MHRQPSQGAHLGRPALCKSQQGVWCVAVVGEGGEWFQAVLCSRDLGSGAVHRCGGETGWSGGCMWPAPAQRSITGGASMCCGAGRSIEQRDMVALPSDVKMHHFRRRRK